MARAHSPEEAELVNHLLEARSESFGFKFYGAEECADAWNVEKMTQSLFLAALAFVYRGHGPPCSPEDIKDGLEDAKFFVGDEL